MHRPRAGALWLNEMKSCASSPGCASGGILGFRVGSASCVWRLCRVRAAPLVNPGCLSPQAWSLERFRAGASDLGIVSPTRSRNAVRPAGICAVSRTSAICVGLSLMAARVRLLLQRRAARLRRTVTEREGNLRVNNRPLRRSVGQFRLPNRGSKSRSATGPPGPS